MSVENLVKTLMEEFKVIVRAETVVGEPIQVDKATIIPVSKISFGFGAGGGGKDEAEKEEKKPAKTGQGIGGGGAIDPIAFIVIQDDKIKLMSLVAKELTIGKVVDLVPEILNRIKGKSASDDNDGADEGEKPGKGK
jgi:sporulation protein YtfJ